MVSILSIQFQNKFDGLFLILAYIFVGHVNKDTNQREKIGVWIFRKGAIYEGYWANDTFHGAGMYMWYNGSFYSGEWDYGKIHKDGYLLTYYDVETYWQFENNELINSDEELVLSDVIPFMPNAQPDLISSFLRCLTYAQILEQNLTEINANIRMIEKSKRKGTSKINLYEQLQLIENNKLYNDLELKEIYSKFKTLLLNSPKKYYVMMIKIMMTMRDACEGTGKHDIMFIPAQFVMMTNEWISFCEKINDSEESDLKNHFLADDAKSEMAKSQGFHAECIGEAEMNAIKASVWLYRAILRIYYDTNDVGLRLIIDDLQKSIELWQLLISKKTKVVELSQDFKLDLNDILKSAYIHLCKVIQLPRIYGFSGPKTYEINKAKSKQIAKSLPNLDEQLSEMISSISTISNEISK